jgi:hypothetical protein
MVFVRLTSAIRPLFIWKFDTCGRRKPIPQTSNDRRAARVDVATPSEKAVDGMRQVQAKTYFHRRRGWATSIGVPPPDDHFPPLSSSAGALRKPAHAPTKRAACNNHALHLPPQWVQDSATAGQSLSLAAMPKPPLAPFDSQPIDRAHPASTASRPVACEPPSASSHTRIDRPDSRLVSQAAKGATPRRGTSSAHGCDPYRRHETLRAAHASVPSIAHSQSQPSVATLCASST